MPSLLPRISVIHHRYDDSLFINGTYVVKGVAGALMRLMLARYLAEGQSLFTNRELRLSVAARLPGIKDNLETRLLLLRRRLEEKHVPIRLIRAGRGCVRLEAEAEVELIDADEQPI